jgi:exonuclease III
MELKITGNNNHWSLISLNINGLNSPIKRHRLTGWLCKQDPAFCCLQKTHLSDKDRDYLKVKTWKKKVFRQIVPRNNLE